jgi:hypothetical protein
MKRVSLLIVTILLWLNFLGGPVWAATSSTAGGSTTVTTSTAGSSWADNIPILGQILSGVNDIKTSVGSVVSFFTNFDPGKIINDWIKQSISDFLRPILSWAEQNAAKYSYFTSTDPAFGLWQFLVVLSLALMLYATLRLAGQVMEGKRTAGDILIALGLILWLFLSVWATNLMVYVRNHLTYHLLQWIIQQGWLSSDTLQSTAQFIIPDLSKTILANQDAVSAILAFILGGSIMALFEAMQGIVYGVWQLLIIASPIFTVMTALAADFSPFTSYLGGLARTLLASMVITMSWGIQGYVYLSQTDTILQIIFQAMVVVITCVVLWMFWLKYIETEILGMLTHPLQTVKGHVTAAAGQTLQTAGRAAGILGAVTGNSTLAAMGHKTQTAGDVIAEEGEQIKVQASHPPRHHHDILSRMVERNFQQPQTTGNATSGMAENSNMTLKTTFKKPFTKPPSLGGAAKPSDSPSGNIVDSMLDHIEQKILPDDGHEFFSEVSMPGGGTFFRYDGPMADDIADQLQENGVKTYAMDDHWAVDLPDEKIAKYVVLQNLSGRQRYWVYKETDPVTKKEREAFVTVDPYGVTHFKDKEPDDGVNMGPWQKPKKDDDKQKSGDKSKQEKNENRQKSRDDSNQVKNENRQVTDNKPSVKNAIKRGVTDDALS